MQAAGTLGLIAELAVAFTGFTSIVAVFGSQGESGWSEREAAYLRLLVEYSLVTLLTAVLPLILWNAGLSERHAWRVASAATAIQIAAYYGFRFRNLREQRGHFGAAWVGGIVVAGDWVFVALLLLGSVGVVVSASTVYVALLFWMLLGTSVTFAAAIAPLWDRRA